jgi:prophage antirepressor-like protein
MNSLNSFTFGHNPIRVVLVAGEPHWVAKDVADALGYTWSGSRIKHVPEEWRGVTSVVTPSGSQEVAILSEQGLYFFLARSDKAAAFPFQKWVAGEVLPSIRKTGSFSMAPAFRVPQTLAEALRMASELEEERASLACKVQAQAQDIQALEPLAEAAQAITCAPVQDAQSFDAAAKVLGTGPNRLFDILRRWRWIKPYSTLPYQDQVDNGNMVVRERLFQDVHKVDRIQHKTLITGKGLVAIRKRMAAEGPAPLVRPQHR